MPKSWNEKVRLLAEQVINALTEMDMRNELRDKPGGGVVRTANRWKTSRPRKRKKRHP